MANVPLAEWKAKAQALDQDIRKHRQHCRACQPRKPCTEAREMAADLAAMRQEIRTWFDPGPDQGMLA